MVLTVVYSCMAVVVSIGTCIGISKCLKEIINLATIIYKVLTSEDPGRLFNFFKSLPREIRNEASKLPNETFNKIFNANSPWDAFLMVERELPSVGRDLKNMMLLAGYSKDLIDIIKSNASALIIPNANNKQPLREILCILDTLSYLSKDDLNYIITTGSPVSILQFLSAGNELMNDSDKREELIELIRDAQFRRRLQEWLPFFEGYYELQKRDIELCLKLKSTFNATDKFWGKFVNCKITNGLNAKELEKRKEGKEACLNIEKLLNDPDMDKWNVLKRVEIPSQINNIRHYISRITTEIMSRLPIACDNLLNLCVKCIASSDSLQSPNAHITIINRILSINYYMDESINEIIVCESKQKKLQLIKELEIIVRILNIDPNTCPDGAIIALELAENVIKMLNNPQYICNVIAHMFKLNTIKAKLLRDSHIENVETFLYYFIVFNNYLGLGHSTKSMFNVGHADVGRPLPEALAKVLEGFTAPDLIGFAANLDAFRLIFNEEAQSKLNSKFDSIKKLMTAVYGIENMEINEIKFMIHEIRSLGIELEEETINEMLRQSDDIELANTLSTELGNKLIRIEDNFYEDKARELFLKSDYISIPE